MDDLQPSIKPKRKLLDSFLAYAESRSRGDRFLFNGITLAVAVSLVLVLIGISTKSQVEIPTFGGSYTEGVLGTPRFVNPVLAVTNADKDLSALIYDGLMKLGSEGSVVPNIAESVTISEDKLTYNIVLRKDVTFHDETPLTADDVVFTVGRIQDPALQSPLRANFTGVTVEKLGDYEINFVLTEPYAPFIENLTFGILPRHIWKDATNEEFPFSQHNSEPIGAGPYMIERIQRNTSGIPESYVLKPYPAYHLGQARIETFTLNFYPNEDRLVDAFSEGIIQGIGGVDSELLTQLAPNESYTIHRTPLPRTFAVFFNQNKSPILRDHAVRKALDISIDRTGLISTVLGGFGNTITTPIPPGFGAHEQPATSTVHSPAFDEARAILRDAGWKIGESGVWEKEIDGVVTPLTFSIATANNSVFEATAEYLRSEWAKLGITVAVKQFEQSDLTQSVIRPRDYEALLFGTAVGRSLDFYSFWHSSQRNDPGLNVALYTNITSDSILSEARRNTDFSARKDALIKFSSELEKEIPAIFLYSPEYLYITEKSVTGITLTGLAEPSERFASGYTWYINTESVWPFFKDRAD